MEISLAGGGDARFPNALRSPYDRLVFSFFGVCLKYCRSGAPDPSLPTEQPVAQQPSGLTTMSLIAGTTTDDPDGRLVRCCSRHRIACSPARGYFRSRGAAVRDRERALIQGQVYLSPAGYGCTVPPDRDRRVKPGDDIAGCVDLIPRPITRSPARAGAIAAPDPASAGVRPSPHAYRARASARCCCRGARPIRRRRRACGNGFSAHGGRHAGSAGAGRRAAAPARQHRAGVTRASHAACSRGSECEQRLSRLHRSTTGTRAGDGVNTNIPVIEISSYCCSNSKSRSGGGSIQFSGSGAVPAGW